MRSGQQRMRWLESITNSDGHELEQAPGVGDGQRGLACCSPWGCRVRHDGATKLKELKLLIKRSDSYFQTKMHIGKK